MIEDITKAVRSAHIRAKISIVVLMIVIAVDSISVLSTFSQIQLLKSLARGVTLQSGVAESNDARQAAIGVLQGLLFLVTAVTFLMWMYKAHSNLPLLGARKLEYSPGWTIGGFLVPFYCFVRPFSVMSEIWRASDPNGEGEQSWQWQNPPAILRWWWGFFLVTNFLGKISARLLLQEGAADIHTLINNSSVLIISDIFDVLAAVAAALAIWSVDAKQGAELRRLPAAPPASAIPEPA